MIVITDGSIITLPQSLRNLYIDYVIKPRIWMPAYNFTTGRNRKLFRETWSWTRAATYRALHRFPSQRRYIIQIDPNWSAITKEQGLYIYIYLLSLSSCLEEKPNRSLHSIRNSIQKSIYESNRLHPLSPQDNVFPREREISFCPRIGIGNVPTISWPVEIQLDFRETRGWPQQYRFPPTIQLFSAPSDPSDHERHSRFLPRHYDSYRARGI